MTRNLALLAGLMALSGAVQCWCISAAVVPAQDSLRFVRYAQAVDRDGLLPTLENRTEPALFPVLVWTVHTVAGGDWARSAQIAAAAPLVLAVAPLWFLLRCVVPPGAAAVGTLLFTVMTVPARLGADGLSDSTHLLFLCLALWAVAEYLAGYTRREETRPTLLLLAGGCVGAAVMARQESLVLVPVLAMALLLLQSHRAWRQPWRLVVKGTVGLAVGFVLVWGPFLAATGSWQPSQAAARIRGMRQVAETPPPRTAPTHRLRDKPRTNNRPSPWRTADGEPMSFLKKDPQTSLRFDGFAAGVKELVRETPRAFQYWVGLLAMFGLAWVIRPAAAFAWRPWDVFAGLFFLVYCLAAAYVAAFSGYLSSRHLLPLVVVALPWAGVGALELGRLLADGAARIAQGKFALLNSPAGRRALGWTPAAAAALACLPITLAPLHASHRAHRNAAAWLAQASLPAGAVLDTRGWTGLYSGRTTYGFRRARRAIRDRQLVYVVLERHELEHDSQRSRSLRELLTRGGQRVAVFQPDDTPREKAVEVYRWNRRQFRQRTRAARLAN